MSGRDLLEVADMDRVGEMWYTVLVRRAPVLVHSTDVALNIDCEEGKATGELDAVTLPSTAEEGAERG